MEDKTEGLLVGHFRLGGMRPFSIAFESIASLSRPLPSSIIRIITCAPNGRRRGVLSRCRFCLRDIPFLRCFYTMIYGIPYEMDEWIVESLDHGLIEALSQRHRSSVSISFPSSWDKSRMSLLNRPKIVPIGSIRMFNVVSRSSAVNAPPLRPWTRARRYGDAAVWVKPCLNRDEFPHEVDKHVELVCRNPDARYALVLCLDFSVSFLTAAVLLRPTPPCPAYDPFSTSISPMHFFSLRALLTSSSRTSPLSRVFDPVLELRLRLGRPGVLYRSMISPQSPSTKMKTSFMTSTPLSVVSVISQDV